jgi:glycosyltransferase involved in cell wall biosynthesis
MKIMLYFWEQEISNEILSVASFLSDFNYQFVLTPLIRVKDKAFYEDSLVQLSNKAKNVSVDPVYLKSANSSFSNLLKLNTVMADFFSIRKVVKRSKPDVIVCFYLSHAYPLVLMKPQLKFSLCTVAMGSDVNLENGLLQKKARKYVYNNSDLIFTRSWLLKEKVEEEHACNAIVNPSSTSTLFFKPFEEKTAMREKWDINPTDKVVLTVCRLDKNKGVDVLLKSIAALATMNITLLVVGEGEEKTALQALSSSLGLGENVVFLGQRNKQELLELYNLSDVFALASYSEGLPRVLLEAMACGCVPVATNVGSVGSLISDGITGFIIEPGSEAELREAIIKVFSMSTEHLQTMQDNARKVVLEGFDSRRVWGSMIEKIDACFSETVVTC